MQELACMFARDYKACFVFYSKRFFSMIALPIYSDRLYGGGFVRRPLLKSTQEIV